MRCIRCGSFDMIYMGKNTYCCAVCKNTAYDKMPVICDTKKEAKDDPGREDKSDSRKL